MKSPLVAGIVDVPQTNHPSACFKNKTSMANLLCIKPFMYLSLNVPQSLTFCDPRIEALLAIHQ